LAWLTNVGLEFRHRRMLGRDAFCESSRQAFDRVFGPTAEDDLTHMILKSLARHSLSLVNEVSWALGEKGLQARTICLLR
jgi:hypothetical protein